eukprot:3876426-Rhodomonas_salina.1
MVSANRSLPPPPSFLLLSLPFPPPSLLSSLSPSLLPLPFPPSSILLPLLPHTPSSPPSPSSHPRFLLSPPPLFTVRYGDSVLDNGPGRDFERAVERPTEEEARGVELLDREELRLRGGGI